MPKRTSERTSILLLSVGHACVDVYQGAVAALVPFFVAERHYTYAAVSGVVLAASLLSSVAQPLFGALTDRRPLPWLLPAGTLTGGAGIALGGVSGSYGLTLASVALSGIGVAAYHPESARVARLAARGGRGGHRGMAWFSLGGNLGFAAAPLLVAAVVGTGGLRLTPLLALPALAGAVLCLPVLRELERRRAAGAGGAKPPVADDRASFVKLSLAVVCRSIAFVGLSTFLPLFVAQRLGGGTAAGTAALVVLYAGGAVGSVLGGALADRWGRVTAARRSYLVAAAAVAGVLLVPGPALYPCVALTSAGLYVPFSLQVTLGQDYLPSRVGTASGITLGLTVSVGGLAGPLIGGLADAASLRTALLPLVLMPVLSWALFRTLPEPAGAPEDEPAGPGGVRAPAAPSR
ncbi:MFS transporter [Streptomyces sp. NRRL S-350]|uniref:MFS transporter n=1 Tax=Streptomyces sp. NRRL S-350 TaxID=1463902 RepID=UPI00056C18B9|nr:MFS transporter [Streptomyces sp. NRRL S-350]